MEDRFRRIAWTVLGTVWCVFQLVILFDPQAPLVQRPVHLALALALFFAATPRNHDAGTARGTRGSRRGRGFADAALILGVLAVLGYYLASSQRLADRMEAVDPVLAIDVIFGLLLVGIVLEAVRRTVGWMLLGVILLFLAFGFLGRLVPGWTEFRWLPELLKFSGFTLPEAAENFTMTPNGLLGVTTYTSLSFVFYFVLFGAIYSAIGGGQLFIDIGLRLAGKQRGGAGKAAVISSSLMGSISGSAVANVATTGLFTIPLMRRAGYSASMAGAIEAIASTGGQLMPPIMGVAAFVMAELLQEPYGVIALAGLIPALAFYGSLLLTVDLHARRTGLEVPPPVAVSGENARRIRDRLHLLIPLAALIGLLTVGFAANLCAVFATGTCFLLGISSVTPAAWMEVLRRATRQAAQVAIPIAAIGLIIEVAVQSSLVLKFSVSLIDLSGGTLLGALFWVVLACVIMGMGLPTVAAYIIGATLFVPALLDLGVERLPAHFFVMYYCVLSMVTPPVALASYTAAGLAEAPVMRTCLTALRLSLVAFLIPFAFVFNPALLAQGSLGRVTASVGLLLIGTSLAAIALEGQLGKRALKSVTRISLGSAALLVLWLPVAVHLLGRLAALNPRPAGLLVLSAAFFLIVLTWRTHRSLASTRNR